MAHKKEINTISLKELALKKGKDFLLNKNKEEEKKDKKEKKDKDKLEFNNVFDELNKKEGIPELKLSLFEKIKLSNTSNNFNLPSFEKFIYVFKDEILNNINKPGITIEEILILTAKKMNNNGILGLAGMLKFPGMLNNVLENVKDKDYSRFYMIFTETYLPKLLKYISVIEEYLEIKKKYKEVTDKRLSTVISNIFLQGVLMSGFIVYSFDYIVISNDMLSFKTFANIFPWHEVFFGSLIFSIINAPDLFVKIVYGTQLVGILMFIFLIIYFITKFFIGLLKEKNLRNLDKLYNEIMYSLYLKIKTYQYELPGLGDKVKYINVNYMDFFLQVNNEAFKYGFINYDFYNRMSDFVLVFKIMYDIKPSSAVGFSDLFYNLISMLFQGYKNFISGSFYNFNLKYILDKVEKVYSFEREMFLGKQKKSKESFIFYMMMLMLLIVGIASVYGLGQSDKLTKAIKREMVNQ